VIVSSGIGEDIRQKSIVILPYFDLTFQSLCEHKIFFCGSVCEAFLNLPQKRPTIRLVQTQSPEKVTWKEETYCHSAPLTSQHKEINCGSM
jgi:hypothetical protein